MRLFPPLLLVFLAASSLYAQKHDISTLEHLQVWTRHGERGPTAFIRFPTDPDDYGRSFRAGEMTDVGNRQEFDLGARLRDDYAPFIGDATWAGQQRFLAGVDNRTVVSALLALQGLFGGPSASGFWLPLPVHTVPELDQISYGVCDRCPALSKEVLDESNEFLEMVDPTLLHYLEEKTGLLIDSTYELQRILDSINVKYKLGSEDLPLPEWAYGIAPRAQQLVDSLHSLLIDRLDLTSGAVQIDQLLGHIEQSISSPPDHRHQFVLVSGHDTNIMVLARRLKLIGPSNVSQHLADYGEHLSIELHRLIDDLLTVQIWHAPAWNGTRVQVHPADCPSPCTWDKFQAIAGKRMTTARWGALCLGEDEFCADNSLYVVGGLLILSAVLLVCAVMGCCTALGYRRVLVSRTTSRDGAEEDVAKRRAPAPDESQPLLAQSPLASSSQAART